MKGAEGEGVKISEREKGGVSGIPWSPRTLRMRQGGCSQDPFLF